MNRDIIESEMGDLTTKLNEMMASTAAVKGSPFADTVATNFESMQLMDVIARLGSLAEEGWSEYAASLVDNGHNLISSIISRATENMTEADLKESISVAQALLKKRNEAIAAVQKGMQE